MEGEYNMVEGGQTGRKVNITGWRVDRRDGGWTDGVEGEYNRLEGGQTGWRVDTMSWRMDMTGWREDRRWEIG